MAKATTERKGIRSGTAAPDFTVRNLRGGEIMLSTHRGRRVLLVFSDPGCPECDYAMEWLEQMHRQVKHVDVLLVSRGSPAPTWGKVQQYELTLTVGLQRHWEVSALYGLIATPVGYAINAAGVIEAEVAAGTPKLRELGDWMAAYV